MNIQQYIENDNILKNVTEGKEAAWINPRYLSFDKVGGLTELIVSDRDIAEVEERLQRFAPFIVRAFPETAATKGIIESPLAEINNMKNELEKKYKCIIPGRLFLKKDSHLAVAGSIKARGGIHEVLKHAETLALENGKINLQDNYARFADTAMQTFFSQYSVQVGSTGNLGMSIGIMSAALGFKAIVHMSADAKAWKKELLRSHGVKVIEYAQDYSKAVEEGRKASDADEMSYFVDDEKSVDLFTGYAVAANRLVKQFEDLDIAIDDEHPLIVYIPAGVGGAPGGVAYGLKRVFKDNVHCFFVEPTQCPSVLLGIATQLFEKANVRAFGLSGKTEADGLACASPSGFVTRIMTNLLSGEFTINDAGLYDFLRSLYKSENEQIEPSSCAAFMGPVKFMAADSVRKYCNERGLDRQRLANSIQIVWATGGRLVPADIREKYLAAYIK